MSLIEQCEKRWQDAKYSFTYAYDPDAWQHEVRIFAFPKRGRNRCQIAIGFGATKKGAYAMADTCLDEHLGINGALTP